jgi:hypothetical protein
MLNNLAEPSLTPRAVEPNLQPPSFLRPNKRPSPMITGTANLETLPSVSIGTIEKTFRGKAELIAKQPLRRGISKHLHELEIWADDPRHHRQLRRDVGRWNQMLSSLQALKQTNLAVTAFQKHGAKLAEGERLLAIYGLLQALVLQQDALCHLAEALKTTPIRLNRHRRLEEIRNIRNWSVGHPTKADRGPALSHHAIARPKLGRGGFSLHSSFDDGRFQYMYVPLPQLARLQRRVISALLRNMLNELKAEVPLKRVKRRHSRKPFRGTVHSGPIRQRKGQLRKIA